MSCTKNGLLSVKFEIAISSLDDIILNDISAD